MIYFSLVREGGAISSECPTDTQPTPMVVGDGKGLVGGL